ncbi:MAG: oligosaccharide flippase family protein [Promethearchaeota archaeon]
MELQESDKSESADFDLSESNEFVQNSYILMVGYLISSIISTIGSIIVIRLISVEEYSLISIAYILPGILIPFGELGLNYASINFIARKLKENDLKGVRNVIRINLIVKIIIGLILTLSVAYFSLFIAKEIYNVSDSRLYLLIQIASISVIANILYDAVNSFFIGAQKMRLVQYGAILHTTLRTLISIVLVLIGYSLIGPIIGVAIAPLIVVMIYMFFLKKEFKTKKEEKSGMNWKELSKMVKYGFPLLIFSILAGIQGQIFILLLTYYGYLNEVSYFNVAVLTAAVISILNKAISFSLFPIFSKMDWNNEEERKTLINYFQFSIKFGTLLILPVTILLILFAGDIFPIVFGSSYREASPFISVYFLMFILVSFGSLSIPAFFNGQGQTKYVLYITIVELISGVIFALILISYFGAMGLMYGVVLGAVVGVFFGCILIRIKYGKVLFSNFKTIFLIFLLSIIIGVFIYYLNRSVMNIFPIKGLVIRITFLAISFIIYGIIFLFLIGLFSLISIDEIDFVAYSFQRFPIIDKLIIILANIEKKIVNLRLKNK